MSDINKLRRDVYRAQKRAEAKKLRMQSRTGAELDGTRYDPVRSGGWVRKASTRELQSQLRKLDNFNSPKTQYYGDYDGKPIPGSKWKALEREVNAFNKQRQEYYDKVKDIRTSSGVTVDQAAQLRTGKHVNYIDDFRTPKTVNSHAFFGERSVDKAIKRYRKLNRRGVESLLKDSRKHFEQIVKHDAYADTDLIQKVRKLSDEQFMLLWSATDFKKFIATNYENYKEGITRYNEDPVNENKKNLDELIGWVESPKVTKHMK